MSENNKVTRDYVFSVRTTREASEDLQKLSGLLSAMSGRRVGKAEAMEIAIKALKENAERKFANEVVQSK